MSNTNPSTEVFGNLCAGTYYIRVDGSAPSSDAESLAKYSFKLYIEPLKYSNDTGEINDTLETATPYTIASAQEGNLISNGVINGKFFSDQFDCYYFNATTLGKYSLSIDRDGFLQGNVSIQDSKGYGLSDFSYMDFFVQDNTSQAFYSYEKHKTSARNFKATFSIKTTGKYFIKIQKAPWSAGS